MTTIYTTKSYYFLSALIILLFCFGLFYLDKDTKNFFYLFKPGNLIALIIYFIPTYLLCFSLYKILERRNNKNSFILALSIGVPVGFILVIVTLSFFMGRL